MLEVHPTTVRAHLERLTEAGVLEEEEGVPSGRGRPSKRSRLRQPLLGGEPEVRLFVSSLVSLLRTAYGDRAVAAAEEEGVRKGRELARVFRHPSFEQAVREVVETLTNLSFAPDSPVRRADTVGVDVRHCPFSVDPQDPDGAVVCGFHQGLIRGLAETASGQEVGVALRPFIAPGVCRVELFPPKTRRKAATPKAKKTSRGSRPPVVDQ